MGIQYGSLMGNVSNRMFGAYHRQQGFICKHWDWSNSKSWSTTGYSFLYHRGENKKNSRWLVDSVGFAILQFRDVGISETKKWIWPFQNCLGIMAYQDLMGERREWGLHGPGLLKEESRMGWMAFQSVKGMKPSRRNVYRSFVIIPIVSSGLFRAFTVKEGCS